MELPTFYFMNRHSVNNFPQYVLFFRKNTYFSLKTMSKKDISYPLLRIAYILIINMSGIFSFYYYHFLPFSLRYHMTYRCELIFLFSYSLKRRLRYGRIRYSVHRDAHSRRVLQQINNPISDLNNVVRLPIRHLLRYFLAM